MTCEVHVTPELVSHLFYLTTFVLKLWTDVKDWLSTLDIDIPLDLKVIERENLPHQGCGQIIVQPAQVQDQTINKRESEHIKDAL